MSNRVTVVMPVFNGMPYIRLAVESVLAQTYDNFELVILDNCSTDGTFDYLQTLDDSRIELVRNDTNLGMDGNWNKALTYAPRSPYFKLVCADDLVRPNAIATEVAALDAYPEVVMTAARRTIIDQEGAVLLAARGLPTMSGIVDGETAIRRCVQFGTNLLGEPTAVLLRSSVLEEVGLFNNTHHFVIDFDMWTRVLTKGSLYAIKEPLAAFRVGAQSNSTTIVNQHTADKVAFFRELASDPSRNISAISLKTGSVMAAGTTMARQAFYKLTPVLGKLSNKR